MEVKDAVKLALAYVADLFKSDDISALGLEEVEHDDVHGAWLVTVGFARPWDYPMGMKLPTAFGPARPESRSYKVVRIVDGEVVSVTNRDV